MYTPILEFGCFSDIEGYIEADYSIISKLGETEWIVVSAWVDRVRLFTPHERRYILNFSVSRRSNGYNNDCDNLKIDAPQDMTVDSYYTLISNSINLSLIDTRGGIYGTNRICESHTDWENKVVAMLITSPP